MMVSVETWRRLDAAGKQSVFDRMDETERATLTRELKANPPPEPVPAAAPPETVSTPTGTEAEVPAQPPATAGTPPVTQGRAALSALGQGASMGFLDEGRARIAAIGDADYAGELARIREEQHALKETYPKTYTAGEIAGSIAPALIPGGAALTGGRVIGTGARMGRAALGGAGVGAVEGYGRTEETDPLAQLEDVGISSATGAVVAPVAGEVVRGFVNFVGKHLGALTGTAVEREIRRRVAESGMTADRVVTRMLTDKETMAEMSPTLRAAAKAYVVRGGAPAQAVLDAVGRRFDEGVERAQGAIDVGLRGGRATPGQNILADWTRSDEAIREGLGGRYDAAYAAAPSVPQQVTAQVTEALQRDPATAAEISRAVRATTGEMPYFHVVDGRVELLRPPTLQEAELTRSALRDSVDAQFRAGQGTTATALKDQEKRLRSAIDQTSPDLAATRAEYAVQGDQARSFQRGQEGLNKDPEAFQLALDRDPQPDAFREGVAQSLNRSWGRGRTVRPLIDELADPRRERGRNLREAVVPEFRLGLEEALDTAAQRSQTLAGVQPRSDTAGNIISAQKQGVGAGLAGAAADVALAGGNPLAALPALRGMIQGNLGGALAEADAEKVAQILVSEDPDFVAAALKGNVAGKEIARRVRNAASAVGVLGAPALIDQLME